MNAVGFARIAREEAGTAQSSRQEMFYRTGPRGLLLMWPGVQADRRNGGRRGPGFSLLARGLAWQLKVGMFLHIPARENLYSKTPSQIRAMEVSAFQGTVEDLRRQLQRYQWPEIYISVRPCLEKVLAEICRSKA